MQPRLLALKSAVPPHILNQSDVSVRAAALFESRRRDMARFMPVFETNEAYKLGINYVIYGLTH